MLSDSVCDGKNEISLEDIQKEIAVAYACVALSSTSDAWRFQNPSTGTKADLHSLLNSLMTHHMYREAVLFARFTKLAETTMIFSAFTEWCVIFFRKCLEDN